MISGLVNNATNSYKTTTTNQKKKKHTVETLANGKKREYLYGGFRVRRTLTKFSDRFNLSFKRQKLTMGQDIQ